MTDIHDSTFAPKHDCVFCQKRNSMNINTNMAQNYVMHYVYDSDWPYNNCIIEVMVFEPLDPVVPGHVLVVPVPHSPDAAYDSRPAAAAMKVASEVAGDMEQDCNIITSVGPLATQTVWHLHLHVVPRREGDGLSLPWTGQVKN